jgi:MFS family permease
MDMLSRYLYAISNTLPTKSARGDIVAEIADDLQSQIEERESALGRPLTNDEEAAVIKAYGHPRVVAARYNIVPYLIGPESLPFYWYALRTTLTVVIAIELIGGAIAAIVTSSINPFLVSLDAAWNSAIYIVGIVTAVFAIVERVPSKKSLLDRLGISRWDPRRLPTPRGTALTPVSRFESLFGFIFGVFALLALIDVGNTRSYFLLLFLLGPLAGMNIPVHLSASWQSAYITVTIATAMIAAMDIAAFVRPSITAIRLWTRVAANILAIIGIALTLGRPPLILPADSLLNQAAVYGLIGAIAVLGLITAFSLRTLFRHNDATLTAAAAIRDP